MDKDVIEQRFHNGVGPDKRWACIGWRSEVVCEAFDFFDNISCITVFFYQSPLHRPVYRHPGEDVHA